MICVAPIYFLSSWSPVIEKFILGQSVSNSNGIVNELSTWFCMFGEFKVLCKEDHFDGVSSLVVPLGVYQPVAVHAVPVLTFLEVSVVAENNNVPGDIDISPIIEENDNSELILTNQRDNRPYVNSSRITYYNFTGNATYTNFLNFNRYGFEKKVMQLRVRSTLSKIKVRRSTYYLVSSAYCFKYFHRSFVRIGCCCGMAGFPTRRCSNNCFVDSECDKCVTKDYLHQLSEVNDAVTLKQGFNRPKDYYDRRLYYDKRTKLTKLCEMFDAKIDRFGVRIVILYVDLGMRDSRARMTVMLESKVNPENKVHLSNYQKRKMQDIISTFFSSARLSLCKSDYDDYSRRNPEPLPNGFSGTD